MLDGGDDGAGDVAGGHLHEHHGETMGLLVVIGRSCVGLVVVLEDLVVY